MSIDTAPHPDRDPDSTATGGIDWRAQLMLALVASIFSGFAAVALSGLLSEQVIVVAVIVLATMASWYQMERPDLGHALTRTHRR